MTAHSKWVYLSWGKTAGAWPWPPALI